MVVMRMGGGAGDLLGGLGGGGAENKRVRFELFVSASNVFNHVNPMGYSGVMTSPFFGQPTMAAPGPEDRPGDEDRVLATDYTDATDQKIREIRAIRGLQPSVRSRESVA